MIKIIANDEYGIKTYAIDTEEDISDLPKTNRFFGSTAICISTGDVYMLNSSGQWVKL